MNKKKEFTFEPDVFETFYNLSIDLNISLKDLMNNVLRHILRIKRQGQFVVMIQYPSF